MVVDATNKVITNSHVQASMTVHCYFYGAKSSVGMIRSHGQCMTNIFNN